MTPVESPLRTVRDLLDDPPEGLERSWPRAACHLVRTGIEAGLDQLWAAEVPELAGATMRAQLLCLPAFLEDDELAARVSYTYSALSDACHYHPYELQPTVAEILRWLETTEDLLRAVGTT